MSYGHEADPIEDLCVELRAAIGPHWSDQPCRCAELRAAYLLGQCAMHEAATSSVATIRSAVRERAGDTISPSLTRGELLALGDALEALAAIDPIQKETNRGGEVNTLDIERLTGDTCRVSIRSEGERDQHVDLEINELLRNVAVGTSNPANTTGAENPGSGGA